MKILISLLCIFSLNTSTCISFETVQLACKGFPDDYGLDYCPDCRFCSLERLMIDKSTKVILPETLQRPSNGVAKARLLLSNVHIVTFSEEQFEHLNEFTQIILDNCTGLKNLENFLFVKNLESVEVESCDLEVVGEKPFLKMFRLVELTLKNNKIKTVHKNAFVDLTKVITIDLSLNQIQWLDGDTFASCLELQNLILMSNLISSIPAKIFSRNAKLVKLNLANNKILTIDKNGFNNFAPTLTSFDLTGNLCINKSLTIKSLVVFLSQIEKIFAICFANHDVVQYMNGTIDKLLKSNDSFNEITVDKTTIKYDGDKIKESEDTSELSSETLDELRHSTFKITDAVETNQTNNKCLMISLSVSLITFIIVIILQIIFFTCRRNVEAKGHVLQSIAVTAVESKV